MSWRLRSVRKRILLLALVPVISLIGIYTFYTSLAARDAINLARAGTLKVQTTVPTGNILVALNTERPAAMLYLAAPTPANLAAFTGALHKTNRTVDTARADLSSPQTTSNASPGELQSIHVLLAAVKGLPNLQANITSRVITKTSALDAYDGIINDADGTIIWSIRQETNATVVDQALAIIEMARSEEALSSEISVMAGDFASQTFPLADRHLMAELAGARRNYYAAGLADLDPPYRKYWIQDVSAKALTGLTALENQLIADTTLRRSPPPVSPLAWEQAFGGVAAGMSKASNSASAAVDLDATNAAWGTARGLIITGSLGFLAVVISILVAVIFGRSLVRELRNLRESALDLAHNQLPQVVDRLALGHDVDVAIAAPPMPASTEEVRQVKEAFDTVQRTAVEAAVAQARLRQGMSDVFRNLARRSQSLLHRQLTLLDAMERRARDPQELEDLFRIDHLTTRMRRHAESLIILSGHAPARGWRNPVPLVDVLRAAVAEVEDYTRIKTTTGTQASLAGPAVGDVIHMIAELAENATMFSPPNTPVTIHGDIVGQGFAVEIEDRGLGLNEDQIVWINKLLENPPPFDPSSSDQLGLFVAGQLAKRHNIKISMRPSPYGGTTAIVLIPRNLVVTEGGAHAKDPSLAAAPSSVPRIGGRHANRDWETGPSDGETSGPLSLVPSPTTSTDWPGFEMPPMPDPLDTADFGRPTIGTAAPDIGPPGYGVVGAGLDSRGSGGYGPGGSGDSDTTGLPRRVRQASLAPQLREGPLEDPMPAPAVDFDPPSPEQTRSTMSAIQSGWERGRSVFDAGDTMSNGEYGPASSPPPAGDQGGEPSSENGGSGG